MNTWFTSDTHFGHANIINLCNRPFSSVEEMDEEMVQRWNSLVRDNDDIYFLGDLTLGKLEAAENVLSRLKGRIKLIEGNHDKRWFGKLDFGFFKVEALRDIHRVNVNGKSIIISHYPLREWEGMYKGYWHLYGHVHGALPKYLQCLDVGVDSWNFYPVSFEQIAERLP